MILQLSEGKFTGVNKVIKSSSLQTVLDKKEEGTFAEFFDDWKWIFSYSGKYRLGIVIYTLVGLLSSTFSLVAAYVSRILINIVVEKEAENLWILVGLLVGSTIFSLILTSVMSRITTKITIDINNDIRSDIFDKIIDSKWSELTSYKGGDLLNRFVTDVNTISTNAISWIPNLIINVYTFILSFIVLFRLDCIMAFISLLAGPFLLIISRFILRRMRAYRKRIQELRSDMMSFESETFYNIDMIKSFGIMGYYSNKLKMWQKKYKEYNLDYNKFEIKTNIVLTMMSAVVSLFALLYCVFLLWSNKILFGDMTFFLQQREMLTTRFNSLVGTFPGMVNSAVSAHRVRELVELTNEVHDASSLASLSAVADKGVGIKVKDASFNYRDDSVVYENSDFYANPGEVVAILGSSGGGKTTLMRMVLGLVDPSVGSVVLCDYQGNEFPVNSDLRSLFSYVPQGNTVLSGTIAENMRMVKEDATDEEIIAALKAACAWKFVSELPYGINSTLSDNGRGISMGQCQRVSIARALLRNSPIVLLDEATSALDIDTEKRVIRSVIKHSPNKTYVISTHRIGILAGCDRVYRIMDKKLVELSPGELESTIRKYMSE